MAAGFQPRRGRAKSPERTTPRHQTPIRSPICLRSLMKPGCAKSRGRGKSTTKSPLMVAGVSPSTMMRSARKMASSRRCADPKLPHFRRYPDPEFIAQRRGPRVQGHDSRLLDAAKDIAAVFNQHFAAYQCERSPDFIGHRTRHCGHGTYTGPVGGHRHAPDDPRSPSPYRNRRQ